MNSFELVDSFSEFKDFKNIDRPTMIRVLEDVFRTLLRKKHGSDDNFDIIVSTELDRLDGGFDIPMPADHDHRQVGVARQYFLEQPNAVDATAPQPNVEKH